MSWLKLGGNNSAIKHILLSPLCWKLYYFCSSRNITDSTAK